MNVSLLLENIMFKKTVLNAFFVSALLSGRTFASDDVLLFEKDWSTAHHTQFTLESKDLNLVLDTYYETSAPVHFTKDMLWDMDRKKAWDPLSYIPYVVSEGYSWGKKEEDNGNVTFMRWSMQKQWKTGTPGMVIEKVTLLNKEQRAVFIGIPEATDDMGRHLKASEEQPLFHVEHGVGGQDEDHPTNTWRVVHLTQQKDTELMERLSALARPDILPGYLLKYTEKDLGVSVHKKE